MNAGSILVFAACVVSAAMASKEKDCDKKRQSCIQICRGAAQMDFHCDWNRGAVVSSCACAADRKWNQPQGVTAVAESTVVVGDPSEWCFDKRARTDIFTCEQHLKWGDCEKPWMRRGNYCRKTCFGCDCEDVPPSRSPLGCVMQAARERCRSNWMKDNRYCEKSCGMCGMASLE